MMSGLLPRIAGAALFITVILIIFCYTPHIIQSAFFLIVGLIMMYEWIMLTKKSITYTITGLCWITLSMMVIADIIWHHINLALLLFAITISCDIFSYFGGKLFGKIKLAPSISPGKTVEGMAIGVGMTFILTSILTHWLQLNTANWLLFPTLILLTILSVIGDLLESKVKRLAGVKDSGHLFYGHGGFLDRFDSVIFVAPFFYIATLFIF